jgi:tRNA threonylcarbamoyladenosine biosynthesis protein TsaE
MEFFTNSPEETYALAIDFAKRIKLKDSGVKLGFVGDLGAGKTLFIKGLLSELLPGITVTSPTYTIMNVYQNNSITVHHVDLYRINDPEELVMCGFYEVMDDPGSVVLMEWFDRISKTYSNDNDIILISMEQISDNKRRILVND